MAVTDGLGLSENEWDVAPREPPPNNSMQLTAVRGAADLSAEPPKQHAGIDMQEGRGRTRGAIGFTVKSGWASAVLLVGSATSPRVVDSRTVGLSDPDSPESRQPYHVGFGTARDSGPELSRLIASVKRFGGQSVAGAIGQYQRIGYLVRGAGVVVGSLIDPARIANDHIRIHALEGQLFRSVVQDAVARSRLPCSVWRERDLHALAADRLKQTERALRHTLAGLGRDIGRPWRAEQKAAALAAWLILAGHLSERRMVRRRESAA